MHAVPLLPLFPPPPAMQVGSRGWFEAAQFVHYLVHFLYTWTSDRQVNVLEDWVKLILDGVIIVSFITLHYITIKICVWTDK